MSRKLKRRLGVAGVLAAMVAVGVWCFVSATLPPSEVRAGSASPAAPVVASVVGASEADPAVTAAIAQLQADFEALKQLEATAANIAKFEGIVERAEALIAGGKLTASQFVEVRGLIVEALEAQGKYPEMWQAFRLWLDALVAEHGEEYAREMCQLRGDRDFVSRRYHDAMEAYAILAERWPASEEAGYALYQIGVGYQTMDDLRQGLAMMKLVMSTYADGPWAERAYLKAGTVAANLDDLDEAVRLYREFVANRSSSALAPTMQERLALLYRTRGMRVEAVTEYQKLLGMLPPGRRPAIERIIRQLTGAAALEEAQ